MPRTAALLFFILAAYSRIPHAASALPTYIRPCKLGPEFDKCAIKAGQIALPFLAKGDPKLKIPSIHPVVVTKIEITDTKSQSIGMNFTMNNAMSYGLKDGKLYYAKNDFTNKILSWKMLIPKLVILFDYEVQGKVLILPIVGKGPGNITLDNVDLDFTLRFKTENIKGVTYAIPTTSDLKHKLTRVHVKLENLFNGDKTLGKQMNDFMNENWQELDKTIGPSLTQAYNLFTRNVFVQIFSNVPYEELFIK